MPAKTDTQISKAMLVLLDELERTPLDLAAVARLSDERVGGLLEAWHRLRAAADGAIVQLQGEANRREVFRRDGASNAREWQLARFGVSRATARTYNRVGDKAMDLPEMTRALSTGAISLDKMRVLAPVASPETDRRYTAEARRCTVHELEQLLRAE